MKKVITIIIILIVAGVIGLKLALNKKAIQVNAEISGIQVSRFPVTTYVIKEEKFNQSFTISGTFLAFRDLNFVSEVQGRVIKLFAENGDYVHKDQTIAQLDTELISNQLSLAEANYEKILADFRRYEILAKGNAVTQQQLEETEIALKTAKTNLILAQKSLKDTQVKAPVSGIVNRRFIDLGSYLMPGMQIAQIVDVSKLKMMVNISEQRVLQIKKRQKVVIEADLFPNNKIEGFIRSISVQADNSKNYTVEIEFQNPEKQNIRSGMNGSATFNSDENIQVFAIPRTCILGDLQFPKVFVIQNDSVSHLKSIQVGKEIDDMLEILDGLTAGEKVITSGQANLQEGTVVSIINN